MLDVGCGTGILSMFCAKAGAAHVYGVEASQFAEKTRKIVAANGLQGKISILHGKMEDLFLPVESVDVIISEWMGTMLVTESMICSVLFARDHYLKGYRKKRHIIESEEEEEEEIIVLDDEEDSEEERKEDEKEALRPPPLPQELLDGVLADQAQEEEEEEQRGLMMPSECNLFLAPIDLSEHIAEKIDYFCDVYGCDMRPLRQDAIELYLAHATYEMEIEARHLLHAEGMRIKHYDMYTCSEQRDLVDLQRDFEFVLDKDGLFCGFAAWFDSIFRPLMGKGDDEDGAVVLDTSPHVKRTHWSQTLFPLSEQVQVRKGDVVRGKLRFFRNNVSVRDYRMLIECSVKDKTFTKMFFLWD